MSEWACFIEKKFDQSCLGEASIDGVFDLGSSFSVFSMMVGMFLT